MKAFVVCVLLVAVCRSVQGHGHGAPCTGVFVNTMPDFNHNVSGRFFIEDSDSWCIEDFFYDGAGPDAYLYLYYPGDPPFIKGGGVDTRVPGQDRIQFEVGRRYLGERFRFFPPPGHRTCDYGTFGIWCRYASQLFTTVLNLEREFAPEGNISCTPSPGRAFLGSFNNTSNGIYGDLFGVTDKQFSIREFSYDGLGGAEVFFYVFPVGVTPDPTSTDTGTIIGEALPETPISPQARYDIDIPDAMDIATCDFGTLTVWDRANSMFLARIDFTTALFTNNMDLASHNRSLVTCDRPTTRPGAPVGMLSNDAHGVEGTVYVKDAKTFYIQLFSYDARGTGVYFYYYRQGQMVEDTGHGYRINFSSTMGPFPTGAINSYKKITPYVVDLNNAADEQTVNTCDIEYLTIWSEDDQEHYSRIAIPESIFTTDPNDPGIVDKTKVLCTQTTAVPTPRTGGAPPTTSLISAISAVLIAMVTSLFRA